MNNRRDILRHAGSASLVAGVGPLLAACASKPSEPEPPPKPVRLLGMLPVGPQAAASRNGPRVALEAGYPVIVPGRPIGSRSEVIGLVGAMVGLVIVGAAVAIVQGVAHDGESSVQPIGIDVVGILNERLLVELRARALSVLSMTDSDLVREVRGRDTQSLPAEVDAILDVKVVEAFFATSWRSSGYSPTINVLASVKDPRAEMDEVMGYTYYADNRDWGKRRRQFTMPAHLTFARPSDIRSNAGVVQEGLERILDRMVGLIVDDVHRHCTGQTPI